MALRNHPYLPLYVQDFLSDEKLSLCSAEAHGVYIRLMCLMHKSEPYGKITLNQKFNLNPDKIKCFASQLTKQMPFEFHIVTKSLVELVDQKVLLMESDMLIQKRMVEDNEISELRSKAGKEGADKTNKIFAAAKAAAKPAANSEYENEIETKIDIVVAFLNKTLNTNYKSTTKSTRDSIRARLREFPLEDVQLVIENQNKLWRNDEKMKHYLTPDTLFRPSNFEKYLNDAKLSKIKVHETPEERAQRLKDEDLGRRSRA